MGEGGPPNYELSSRQRGLMSAVNILGIVAFGLFIVILPQAGTKWGGAGVTAFLAVLIVADVLGIFFCVRALAKTGEPFAHVKWYWPWAQHESPRS